MIFFLALAVIKMSIVMFNMRLTALTSRKWKYANWTFFGLLVAYAIIVVFTNMFQCNPPRANWDSIAAGKLDRPAKCIPELALVGPLSVMHIVMDFCLLTVPVIVLWKLQMSWKHKVRLFIVFAFGAISCIGSVMRQVVQNSLTTDPLCPSFPHLFSLPSTIASCC